MVSISPGRSSGSVWLVSVIEFSGPEIARSALYIVVLCWGWVMVSWTIFCSMSW